MLSVLLINSIYTIKDSSRNDRPKVPFTKTKLKLVTYRDGLTIHHLRLYNFNAFYLNRLLESKPYYFASRVTKYMLQNTIPVGKNQLNLNQLYWNESRNKDQSNSVMHDPTFKTLRVESATRIYVAELNKNAVNENVKKHQFQFDDIFSTKQTNQTKH